MTIIETTEAPSLATVRAKLDQARARIRDALAERDQLLENARQDLQDAGVDAVLIRRHCLVDEPRVDDIYEVSEWVGTRRRGAFDARPRRGKGFEDYRGPHVFEGRMLLRHGGYRVVLVEEEIDDTGPWAHPQSAVLLIKEPAETETWHHRAVRRLRSLARQEDVRVRVRDRSITLVDPLDNVVHEGDILTAFAFLLNIDLEAIA